VALSHYCCRTTLQCQCHETVLELSVDGVRQPKQYSLEFAAEGEQGRHVSDMTRQRIPGSCCRKRAVTQCRTASCRHQQSRRVSRSEMMPRSKAGNWMNVLLVASLLSCSSKSHGHTWILSNNTAWRAGLCTAWGLPVRTHNILLPSISCRPLLLDEIASVGWK